MDWKKLAEEVKELEDVEEEHTVRAKEIKAETPKPRIGDTILHPSIGRCVFAGIRKDGLLYMRRSDGRIVKLATQRIEVHAVEGQPKTFSITVRKT